MKAWHFTTDKLRDGRPVPPVGEWLEHEGPVEMCRSGLHASRRLIDALYYAPGNLIHRVDVDDIQEHGIDKLVSRKRKILWTVDGEDVLLRFARRCALGVACLWDAPEEVIRDVIDEWMPYVVFMVTKEAMDNMSDKHCLAYRAAAAMHLCSYWPPAVEAARRVTSLIAPAKSRGALYNRRLTSMVMAEHRRQNAAA